MVNGRLVIMGSGETAPTMVGVHREALAAAGTEDVVVLDSPFGFQENATELTERLTDHFVSSLGATVAIASLPRIDLDQVASERARNVVRSARAVFAGPGSPSYALSVWRAHGIGDLLTAVLAKGGSVTLASAAALTAGRHTLPVYEIYKVGEDPYWLDGLDILAGFGVRAAIIPHWNNAEGGTHDTSRCYVGQRRLTLLEGGLDCGIVGVDEHTAAVFDGRRGRLTVEGKGTVTLRGASDHVLSSGDTLDLSDVSAIVGVAPSPPAVPLPQEKRGDFLAALGGGDVDGVVGAMLDIESRVDAEPALRSELRSMITQLGEAARDGLVDPREVVGGFVELLLELRRDARAAERFEMSDRIRDGLAALGVEVRDTGDGPAWRLSDQG